MKRFQITIITQKENKKFGYVLTVKSKSLENVLEVLSETAEEEGCTIIFSKIKEIQ